MTTTAGVRQRHLYLAHAIWAGLLLVPSTASLGYLPGPNFLQVSALASAGVAKLWEWTQSGSLFSSTASLSRLCG